MEGSAQAQAWRKDPTQHFLGTQRRARRQEGARFPGPGILLSIQWAAAEGVSGHRVRGGPRIQTQAFPRGIHPWAVISQRMTGGCYTSSGSLGRSCERAGPLQEFMGSSHPWASTPSASGCAEPLAPAGEGRLPASAPNSAFRDAGCWLGIIGHGGSTCTIVTGKCCHFNFYRTRLS